ncbi:MAG TPA: four helix bundle protein [Ardenticatenaceae bacterium]|nr:four helix bundle protein [Ardenticatenaceae bacterium]
MHKFRELKVWQRAMDLVVEVYRLTQAFPSTEQFGLTSQLRRAAVSIPLNISEGAGSGSDPEFRRFLRIAFRSCYEVMTALELGHRLGYCPQQQVIALDRQADEIAAMIVGLSRSLTSD